MAWRDVGFFALGLLVAWFVYGWFLRLGIRAMERDGELIVRRRRPE